MLEISTLCSIRQLLFSLLLYNCFWYRDKAQVFVEGFSYLHRGLEDDATGNSPFGIGLPSDHPQLSGQDPLLMAIASEYATLTPRTQEEEEEIHILEDKDYPKSLYEHYPGVGQVTGISALPSGDIALFHRADRDWNEKSFTRDNRVANYSRATDSLIRNDTIMILSKDDGASVTTFGSNLFYMPHSIASDDRGNLWVSDVGRHQVMRLPTSMLQVNHYDRASGQHSRRWLRANTTRIWPDIILGEAFVPGNDAAHFCKPSEVAVSSDGSLVYVADGYCNQRVMVFSGSGKFITSFGQDQGFDIVHSLTLIEERNLLCVADRENGRILCFKAGLDGDLESIGELMLNVVYPLGKVFAIASISPVHMLVSSNQYGTNHFDLAALNPFTRELQQISASTDLLAPHSLARTKDGLHVYAGDMSKDAYRKIFKFDILKRIVV